MSTPPMCFHDLCRDKFTFYVINALTKSLSHDSQNSFMKLRLREFCLVLPLHAASGPTSPTAMYLQTVFAVNPCTTSGVREFEFESNFLHLPLSLSVNFVNVNNSSSWRTECTSRPINLIINSGSISRGSHFEHPLLKSVTQIAQPV